MLSSYLSQKKAKSKNHRDHRYFPTTTSTIWTGGGEANKTFDTAYWFARSPKAFKLRRDAEIPTVKVVA